MSVTWGSSDHHRCESVRLDRPERSLCPYCPRAQRRRVTHHMRANGVSLAGGCEWHVAKMARAANKRMKDPTP